MFKLLKILSLGLLLLMSCQSSAQVKKVPATTFKKAVESRETRNWSMCVRRKNLQRVT